MKALRKLVSSLRKSSGGFTLLELVVVLAIMGFLVAMIAPRLAGVVAGAQRNTDDTNIGRLLQATSQFQERVGRLPAEMTSLVSQTGPDTFAAPNVSNNDPRDGKEALSADLVAALPLRLHILSELEALELQRLGITEVRNFNPSQALDPLFNGIPAMAPTLERRPVAAGTAVLMIGAGHGVAGWDNALTVGRNIAHPELAYRIVLGFGQDSELVTAGQLQGAAISPQGTNTDNYLFNNYLLVLPRLAATTERNLPVVRVEASNAAGQTETINLDEAQQVFDLNVFSPEGRTFPPSALWTVNTVN